MTDTQLSHLIEALNYTDKALGFDIYQGDDSPETPAVIDFDRSVQAGMSFVFIKTRQGQWPDRLFSEHWRRSKLSGLLRGGYDWLTPYETPEKQATDFVIQMGNDFGELPCVVDYERQPPAWTQWSSPGHARDYLRRWLERVRVLTGRAPIIYTGPSYWQEFGSTDAYWKQYPLWLAQYSKDYRTPLLYQDVPAPWTEWTFWQFGSKLDGLSIGLESKEADFNYFKKNLAELIKWAPGGTVTPPINPPPPVIIPPVGENMLTGNVLTKLNVRATMDPKGVDLGDLLPGATVTGDKTETVNGFEWLRLVTPSIFAGKFVATGPTSAPRTYMKITGTPEPPVTDPVTVFAQYEVTVYSDKTAKMELLP